MLQHVDPAILALLAINVPSALALAWILWRAEVA